MVRGQFEEQDLNLDVAENWIQNGYNGKPVINFCDLLNSDSDGEFSDEDVHAVFLNVMHNYLQMEQDEGEKLFCMFLCPTEWPDEKGYNLCISDR